MMDGSRARVVPPNAIALTSPCFWTNKAINGTWEGLGVTNALEKKHLQRGRVRNAKELHRPQLALLNSGKLQPVENIQRMLVAINVGICGQDV